MIELILELERVHENISIAVETTMGLISNTTCGYTKLPFWKALANLLEKLSGKQTSFEKTSESINKLVKKIMDDSTKEAPIKE